MVAPDALTGNLPLPTDELARERRLQLEFARHLRDPERHPAPSHWPDDRLAVYRRLFFNNVRTLLRGNFPVASAILDADFDLLLRQFYADAVSHTPRFTEIARELLSYLEQRPELWQARWPFLIELLDYEWLELELMLAPEPDDAPTIQGGTQWRAIADLRLRAYRFPVHQLRPEFTPLAPGQPCFLLLYRCQGGEVRFMALQALSACLLELLMQSPNSESGLCDELGRLFPHLAGETLEVGIADQIRQWHERGIIQRHD